MCSRPYSIPSHRDGDGDKNVVSIVTGWSIVLAEANTENIEGPEVSLFILAPLPAAIKPKRRKGCREAAVPITGLRRLSYEQLAP